MDIYSNSLCIHSECQARCFGMVNQSALLLMAENSTKIYQQVPKPLTRGAINMICVMLIFVLLAAAGTAITVYGHFQESYARKSKSYENYTLASRKSLKDKEAKKSTESSIAWLNGLKSVLSCFCILKNGRKQFCTSNKDQFECFHGIRFLNNLWIVLFHLCAMNLMSLRKDELKHFMGMWSSQLILGGYFSSDAFFVLSGFLNAYFFFDNYNKSNGNVSWINFYLKRFLRLTPVYIVVMGFYTFLFPFMGSGPIWPSFDSNPLCSRHFLWNLLYINNFQDLSTMCMEWCWYLAADMQFYIISPIFLISLIRNPILGYALVGACIVASCIASFILTKQYNLVSGFSIEVHYLDDFDSFLNRLSAYHKFVYAKPYIRINSFLVAILLAHYLYKRKFNRIKLSKIILFLGWIATAILWFIVYFVLFKREESIIEIAVYNGLKHLIYSIGVSWIIFTCLTGHGGSLDRFLSMKIFFPLSKLTYSAYLIHPLVLMRYFWTAENLNDFFAFSMISAAIYVYFWTYVFSFITCFLFEFPVLSLLDLISKKKKTVKQHVS